MVKVVVTAAGGGVAQSIIKSLRGTDYGTVAVDPDPRAAGLYLADEARLGKPLSSQQGLVFSLIDICHETGAKYIFPGFDAELPVLCAYRDFILGAGITPVVSNLRTVRLSDSKLELFHYLAGINFPHIPTSLTPEGIYWEGERYLIKPARGCRSQGIHVFDSLDQLKKFWAAREDSEELLIQKFIDGPEYTCGTVSFAGDLVGAIAMQRELRNGDTYKARVDQNPIVLEFVKKLVSELEPFGPCNFQIRLQDDVPYLLEINARCSGTTAARTLAGFNEPKLVLDWCEGQPMDEIVIEDGLEIYRYWQEVVVRRKIGA